MLVRVAILLELLSCWDLAHPLLIKYNSDYAIIKKTLPNNRYWEELENKKQKMNNYLLKATMTILK